MATTFSQSNPFATNVGPYTYDPNSPFALDSSGSPYGNGAAAGDPGYANYMAKSAEQGGSNSPASINPGSGILGNYAPIGQNGGGWGTILSGGPGSDPWGDRASSGGNSSWGNLFGSMNQGGGYTGVPSANQGFDPWAGNPYAAGMANNIVNGFLQNGQIADKTSDAIWQTMQQQMGSNFQYEQARVQANLMQDKLANDKAAVDAQLALAQGNQSLEAQKLAAQLKMASDQLAAQIEANKQQMALSNAQLAQQGQLGNKSLDTQAATAAAQQAFQQQQLAQQGQLGNKQLDIQSQTSGSAADTLAFQKWLAQQQMDQQNADRTQKNDLLAMIMQNMGGGGGMGGGTGGSSGGSSSGSTGGGFYGPQGQYAINTGVTAGALNPSAIRGSVSAIEGQPGGGTMAGPRGGMTGAQQNALSQDMGAMNFAGGQAAGNEALRKFLPQNAQLDLSSTSAKNGMNLGYAQFLAEQERGVAGRQQNQNSLYLQLMNAL